MRRNTMLKVAGSIALYSAMVACSGGSEQEGRIHVTAAEVVGAYRLDSERLELRADGTFAQDIPLSPQPIHRTGRWQIVDHFLDGSEVLLLDAATVSPKTPDDKTHTHSTGDLLLYVHNRSGKIALTRNEVADAYYERSE